MASRGDREPRTVLVSTGATDPAGLGLSVSHALLDRDSTVAVTRVVGPDSMELAGDACRANLCWLHHQDLAGGLGTATVYVGAAGTTRSRPRASDVPR